MIRSIPVADSSARILRPSLPIIRPFISSFGSCTTETVFSATKSAAYLWMAVAMIFFDFLSASSFASFSILLINLAPSYRASFSIALINSSFACSAVKLEILSSCFFCSSISVLYFFTLSPIFSSLFCDLFSLWEISRSLRSHWSSLRSIFSSFCINLLSLFFNSDLVSFVSESNSLFILKSLSFTSNLASFNNVSAPRFASFKIRIDWVLAFLIFWDTIFPFIQYAIANPAPKLSKPNNIMYSFIFLLPGNTISCFHIFFLYNILYLYQ